MCVCGRCAAVCWWTYPWSKSSQNSWKSWFPSITLRKNLVNNQKRNVMKSYWSGLCKYVSVADTHRLSFRSLVPLWPWESHSTSEASFPWRSALASKTLLTLDGRMIDEHYTLLAQWHFITGVLLFHGLLTYMCYTAFHISLLPLVQCPPDLLGVQERQFYHVSPLFQEDRSRHHHHALPR